MKKLNLMYTIGVFSFFVLLVFIIVAILLRRIESEIVQIIGVYGYSAIFLITFLVDILPQPLGPEVALISANLIGLNMILAAIITIVGSTLASFFNYKVGKVIYPTISKKKRYTKYANFYKRYGVYGLLISALGPVPYVPFCWLSGTLNLSTRKFLLFGIIPRMIRIILVSAMLFFLNISII
ncbi:MAG: hypothetical protein U9O94_03405 [Nanoarchaeota archaeon]|nr:hypothetical protein [Nanoarchaeota archaeon]